MDKTTQLILDRIKAVRDQTGCSIKQAKDAVEATSTIEEALALVKKSQPAKYKSLEVEAAPRGGYLVKNGVSSVVAGLSTLSEVYTFIESNLERGK